MRDLRLFLVVSLTFVFALSAKADGAGDIVGKVLESIGLQKRVCHVFRDPKDPEVKALTDRMSVLSDQEIIARADKLVAKKKECEASQLLGYIIDRYPVTDTTEDENGNRVTEVLVKEPPYYTDLFLRVIKSMLHLKNYYDAADLTKLFLRRFQTYDRNDYVQFLLGETYYRRIPLDVRLDLTAPRKAQAQYAILIENFADTPYKNIAIERLKFINLWFAYHELEIAKDQYNAKQYYPALLELKNMFNRFKRFENTFKSDAMAQNFYYSCRAWTRIAVDKKAEAPSEEIRAGAMASADGALDALRRFFPDSEWRKMGENLCGKNAKNPLSNPEKNFKKTNKLQIPADSVPVDLDNPLPKLPMPPAPTTPPSTPPSQPGQPTPPQPAPVPPAAPQQPGQPGGSVNSSETPSNPGEMR